MVELTVLDLGVEAGTVDHSGTVEVGQVVELDIFGLVRVLEIVKAGKGEATIAIEYVD